jgi:hypothetical protein
MIVNQREVEILADVLGRDPKDYASGAVCRNRGDHPTASPEESGVRCDAISGLKSWVEHLSVFVQQADWVDKRDRAVNGRRHAPR